MYRLADGLVGMLWGILVGGVVGLGVGMWLIVEPIWFPGDTIVIGACLCGILGFLFGDPFLEWIKEHWHWFS